MALITKKDRSQIYYKESGPGSEALGFLTAGLECVPFHVSIAEGRRKSINAHKSGGDASLRKKHRTSCIKAKAILDCENLSRKE